jgi:hypothetical protein
LSVGKGWQLSWTVGELMPHLHVVHISYTLNVIKTKKEKERIFLKHFGIGIFFSGYYRVNYYFDSTLDPFVGSTIVSISESL